MNTELPYSVKVIATYKDFNPIEFDLQVKYLPNLDGKTKFLDLGTHVFHKNNFQISDIYSNSSASQNGYSFHLTNVIDDQDDDFSNYEL